jgi:hypothetical protein
MISAFKHIRLSGYNLIPQNLNGNTRLTLNSSGVAYYSELTGVSGYLQGLIDTANADVSSINGLQNAVNVSGRDGIQVFVEGQNIVVSGNNTAVQSLITNLTNNLALTGSNLDTKINNLSGYSTGTFATITNLGLTGSTLNTRINTLSGNLISTGANLQGQINSLSGSFVTFTGSLAADFATDAELLATSGVLSSRLISTGANLQSSINSLSGYSNNTFATLTGLAATGATLSSNIATLSGNLATTGSALNTKIDNLSGTLTSNYVQKATQQQFIVTLPTNIESTGITFPVAFASTPNSVQVTFEPSTDVTYMVAVKNRTTAGFTAEFSDVIFEAGNKLNVFASI